MISGVVVDPLIPVLSILGTYVLWWNEDDLQVAVPVDAGWYFPSEHARSPKCNDKARKRSLGEQAFSKG